MRVLITEQINHVASSDSSRGLVNTLSSLTALIEYLTEWYVVGNIVATLILYSKWDHISLKSANSDP